MKLKIKTKFLAVLLIICLLIIIVVSAIHYFFEKKLADTYTKHAINTIEALVQKNNELSNQILTPFTERYLELAVDDISDEILHLLHKHVKINDEILQNDTKLRKLIAKYSYLKTHQVIRFVVLDDNKIVLSFDPTEENKSYHPWFERCPELKKYVISDKHYSGYYNFKIDKVKTPVYMNILHVNNTKYCVAAYLNLKKYLEPSNVLKEKRLNEELVKLETNAITFLKQTIINIGAITLIIIIIILLICIPISLYFATTITKPIIKLRNEVFKLGKGNFDIQLEEEGSLEVVDLIKTFNYLGKELQDYIKNLKKEITARQKVENEIKIAARIQNSMLPEVTDKFNTDKFQIAALLEPALDASGDFFDFFYLPNGKLALLIADVSGKGIPAAFFMALSKTILRNMCETEPDDPTIALEKTNNILAGNNKEFMFITLFLMYYDTETGDAVYANAGHHDAILLNKKKQLHKFGKFNNSIIGVIKDLKFNKGSIKLEKKDTLIIYTDGIPEAISPDKIQFGENNLDKVILENAEQNITDLCKTVIKTVRNYEQDNRFDDSTILMLNRK